MIKMMRIDDRLLHGQVAFVWKNHLGISRIVVANDALINDPMQQVTMKMAVPEGVKLLIRSMDNALHILNDERGKALEMLLVVKDPCDALKIMKGLKDPGQVEHLNIGNSGRINREDRKVLTKEVYINEEEVQALKELLAYQIPFEIQMTPTSSKINVKDALDKFEQEG